MKAHMVTAVAVFIIGFYYGFNLIPIVLCIGLVLAFESMNSSIEKLCDIISQEYSTDIRDVKDISAGSVLIVAIMSLMVAFFLVKEFYS